MAAKREIQVRQDGLLTCTTCGWYHGRWHNGSPSHYCLHPKNVDSVVGAPRGAFDARKPDGVCGPDGNLHTSKAIPDSINFGRH